MTNLIKRSIRLKEFQVSIEKQHFPSANYLKKVSQIEDDQAFFQRTDKYGFTKNHINFSSSEKVLIIGDSFIENIFVDESKRITSRIEELFLIDGKKVQVLNAGVSGATGLNLLNCILNKVLSLKPDIVMFTQPSCDFSALLYENGYFNDSSFFSNVIPSNDTEKQKYETIENNLEQILLVIELITKACHIYNIKLCFSTCCSNSSKRQLKMMNDIIKNNHHLGYDVIDLDNLIPKNETYFYDKQHLNEKGSGYIANIYFDYIKDKLPLNENCTFNKESISFQKLNFYTSVLESSMSSMGLSNISSVSFKLKNSGDSDAVVELLFSDNHGNFANCSKKEFLIKAGYNLELSYAIDHIQEKTKFRFVTDSKSMDCISILYFFAYSVS